ncbi:MAG: 50S ribosomal protein L17 [Candidatus Hepatoplasma vulgare]|nr:MAG: 50S ribosomal protein L17 [Candidatus Hepatoplasma sp.]
MANKRTSQRQSNVHDSARRKRIERNQLSDLILHEKIVINHAKAKEIQKKMDKLVTLGKKDTIAARRQASKLLRNVKVDEKTDVLNKLFVKIAPKYKKRNGGYTRVLKFGNRKGDGSPVSIITFV